MALGLRLNAPGRAWAAVALLLGAGALAGWWLPSSWLDWQPDLAWRQPWRAWSAAFVHWSEWHLLANLAGVAVVAAFGVAARVSAHCALAWLLVWPLTHVALLVQPALAHYGGLSGVLHAGVAAAAAWRVAQPDRHGRPMAWAVLIGLAVKLALEAPWAHVTVRSASWDIAVAPLAHLSGALAGAGAGLAAAWHDRTRALRRGQRTMAL